LLILPTISNLSTLFVIIDNKLFFIFANRKTLNDQKLIKDRRNSGI